LRAGDSGRHPCRLIRPLRATQMRLRRTGHHRTPSASSAWPRGRAVRFWRSRELRVRAPSLPRDSAVFSRASFIRVRSVWRERCVFDARRNSHSGFFALPRTPCAFRLRQALAVPPLMMTSPVAMSGANSSVPFARAGSTRGAEAHPGDLPRGQCRHARTDYTAHRLRTRCARSRTSSIDSIPTLPPEVTRRAEDILNRPTWLGHPVHAP